MHLTHLASLCHCFSHADEYIVTRIRGSSDIRQTTMATRSVYDSLDFKFHLVQVFTAVESRVAAGLQVRGHRLPLFSVLPLAAAAVSRRRVVDDPIQDRFRYTQN